MYINSPAENVYIVSSRVRTILRKMGYMYRVRETQRTIKLRPRRVSHALQWRSRFKNRGVPKKNYFQNHNCLQPEWVQYYVPSHFDLSWEWCAKQLLLAKIILLWNRNGYSIMCQAILTYLKEWCARRFWLSKIKILLNWNGYRIMCQAILTYRKSGLPSILYSLKSERRNGYYVPSHVDLS